MIIRLWEERKEFTLEMSYMSQALDFISCGIRNGEEEGTWGRPVCSGVAENYLREQEQI